MAKASNQKWGIAASVHQLGLLSLNEKNWQEARQYLDQSLTLLREINDKPGIAECLESLGNLEFDQGSFGEAKRYFDESLQLAETFGNKSRIASVKRSLGLIPQRQSNRLQALQLLYQSLTLFAELRAPQVSEVRNDLKAIGEGHNSDELKFKFDRNLGVPYGNRTRVAAVKEKRFTGIQRKPAAWIAP